MDSIIGLLCVLLPVVFSLIGKKLENAGKGGEAVPPVPPQIPQGEPEAESQPLLTKARQRRGRPSVDPVSSEEEKPRKKDPIDPKKLVIYSEIMKPKF